MTLLQRASEPFIRKTREEFLAPKAGNIYKAFHRRPANQWSLTGAELRTCP